MVVMNIKFAGNKSTYRIEKDDSMKLISIVQAVTMSDFLFKWSGLWGNLWDFHQGTSPNKIQEIEIATYLTILIKIHVFLIISF